MVSDVLVSGEITFDDEKAVFKRGNIGFTPHMFSDFKVGEKVGMYFEIYNLFLNENGNSNFRVTCKLQPYGTDNPSLAKQITAFFKSTSPL